MKKPAWFNKKADLASRHYLKNLLRNLRLHTVCEESFCPNISECFSRKVATFMILGDSCTRQCSFCAIKKGKPSAPDKDEPKRIKEAVQRLRLNYVVITSPTRDDLEDGGASVFCETVKEIKSLSSSINVELLIPDFNENSQPLKEVVLCGADLIAHNLETVPRLYGKVRIGADYFRSLKILHKIKVINPVSFTKSGLMLGLGETEEELRGVLRDLRGVGCDSLTLGQYLAPSQSHYELKEYIKPEKFLYLQKFAYKLGFKVVKSGPYVRSSYLAHISLSGHNS